MGIPSYFSYISKSYHVVSTIKQKQYVDFVFLDSNSMIYNAISHFKNNDVNTIYKSVCDQIYNYVSIIRPTTLLMIAFDGVAPFAKLKQQRERRFKSSYIESLQSQDKNNGFDRCCITPGTTFMKQLCIYLKQNLHIHNVQCIISNSNIAGEGEHKIFNYIRNHTFKPTERIYIYGMDADLIILSLPFHNIHLFREDMNDTLIALDINQLKVSIIQQLTYMNETQPDLRIQDYIVLSFFLGNDFLPHSPILNIRTTGIRNLLYEYKQTIVLKNAYITTKNNEINWPVFKTLIATLAKKEHTFLKNEYALRDNKHKYRKDDIQQIPLLYKDGETFINPFEKGWKERYYKRLFGDVDIQTICIKYIEGFEWCLSYYNGKIDTKWVYPYAYPPLFEDILQYTPSYKCELITYHTDFVSPEEQLCYVLPPSSFQLIPSTLASMILSMYPSSFSIRDIQLQWDFCTYLWEAHPILPHIPMSYISQCYKTFKRIK